MNGHGVGIWLDPVTGQLVLAESVHTAMGVLVWLVAVVLGLVTAWLVLP